MKVIKIEDIKDKLIIIRDEQVLLDSDVAEIYGVETKRVNEAVKNNKGKFPIRVLVMIMPPCIQGRIFPVS